MGGASAAEQTREEQRHEHSDLLEVREDASVFIDYKLLICLMSPYLCREFLDCFEGLTGDSECRAVVLSGAGKNFSAGWSRDEIAYSLHHSSPLFQGWTRRIMMTSSPHSWATLTWPRRPWPSEGW